MSKSAIYPGTFDPVTNGHVDIICRGAKIFQKLIIAVAASEVKKPFLSLETRIKLLEELFADKANIEIMGFDNLLSDFAKEQKTSIILRGLRTVSDYEYEFQLAEMNKRLSEELETLFLTPSENCRFISSTLVREIVLLNGDISQFVPDCVVREFRNISR